jgi:non-heme chloroperoxidase
MLPLVVFIIAVGIAVHLYVRSQATKLKSLPDTYTLSAISKEPDGEEVFITTTDGARIRVVSKGTGPTVVLAHGFLITLMEWNVIWQLLLDAGYRVIAFDQRGHGKSTIGSEGMGSRQMAGDYKAVLEHFAVRDAILVGHSMGGFLSLVFMLTYPEAASKHLRGVILFAALVGNVLKDAPQNRLQIPLMKSGIMKRVMQSDSYGFLFGTSLMGDTPSPAAIKAMLPVMAVQKSERLIPILEAMIQEDYSSRLGEIQHPVVVICGRLDSTTPVWQSETLGTKIPNARNVWVEGKGHLLNWEAPQALVEAVKSLS